MNETYVTMVGNAVEDPVRRTTRSDAPFVTFRLASTVRRRRGDGEYEDVGTSFVTVLAFRQLARNIADSVSKGQPLVVTGRLRVNQWTNGDRSGTSVEIDAMSVGHDLSRGVSKFTKMLPMRTVLGSHPVQLPVDGPPGATGNVAGDRSDSRRADEEVDSDLDGELVVAVHEEGPSTDPWAGPGAALGVSIDPDREPEAGEQDDGPLDLGGADGLTARLTG
ncbi:MAG: single-stranded DNA-binding protein [Dermatophilaceae bacterium]